MCLFSPRSWPFRSLFSNFNYRQFVCSALNWRSPQKIIASHLRERVSHCGPEACRCLGVRWTRSRVLLCCRSKRQEPGGSASASPGRVPAAREVPRGRGQRSLPPAPCPGPLLSPRTRLREPRHPRPRTPAATPACSGTADAMETRCPHVPRHEDRGKGRNGKRRTRLISVMLCRDMTILPSPHFLSR